MTVSPFASGMISSPANDCKSLTTLTASASNYLYTGRGIYVGSSGDVGITTPAGTSVTFKNCPTGMVLPVLFIRVNDADTTASELIGLF